MKLKNLLFLFSVIVIPSILYAQNKPILKLEVAPGISVEDYGLGVKFFFPSLYVPITQHLDVGISYNSIKSNYTAISSTGSGPYNYKLRHNFGSLYFSINFSKASKRVNPVIGYIVSATKGKVDFTNSSSATPMPDQDKKKLEDALKKSNIAHGLQVGLDIKVSRAFSLFTRVRAYSLANVLDQSQSGPFRTNPYDSESFGHAYVLIGGIIKISSGKKSQIR